MTIIRPNGRRRAGPRDIQIRKYLPHKMPKCGSEQFCQGMLKMLRDSASEEGNRVLAVGEVNEHGEGSPEGIGFFLDRHQQLLLFNFCPACGGRLKLPANL